MQRIKLGKPYDDYIAQQIESGYFASATEVLRNALLSKMEINKIKTPKKTLMELIQEGEESIKAGRVTNYTPTLMSELFEQAKQNSILGKAIPDYIKPQYETV
jgi:putative addiction module CopG family antidote